MKAVKLHAYWAGNLGDDLMVDILLKRYPHYRFYCDSASPFSNRFLQHPNFMNRESLERKFAGLNRLVNALTLHLRDDFVLRKIQQRWIRQCRATVYVGGSIYMETENETVERRIAYEERLLRPSPLFVIGANFGPYRRKEFADAFAGYFKRCGGVVFRDKTSYDLFSHVPSVRYAPDVVLNLSPGDSAQGDGSILISVIDVRGRKHLSQWADDYEHFVAKMCAAAVSLGKTPVLMSFCEREGDPAVIQRICEGLCPELREQVRTVYYCGDIPQALELFSRAEFVLATRFHAMILALRMGKPFFCLAYSDKIQQVLRDLACDACCRMEDIAGLDAQTVLKTYTQALDCESYCREAAHQFDDLDKYLL